MIWGGIANGYKTDLIIIDGNVNTETYIDQIIFGSNLIETADKKFGIGHWTFMQDNARPHVSKETMAVLKELEISKLASIQPRFEYNRGCMGHYGKGRRNETTQNDG